MVRKYLPDVNIYHFQNLFFQRIAYHDKIKKTSDEEVFDCTHCATGQAGGFNKLLFELVVQK